jgi:hypothetical protein
MPKGETPQFHITADDPLFVPLLDAYLRLVGSRMDLTSAEREKQMDAIELTLSEARAYQRGQGKRKDELDRKRQWTNVK